MSYASMLKIFIPPDLKSLPTLTVDQVNRIPPKARDFLFTLSKPLDCGDIMILSITEAPEIHQWIIQAIEWTVHGEDADFLQNEDIKVRHGPNEAPISYVTGVHNRDPEFTSTPETQRLVEKRIELYVFCLTNGFADLQAYLCAQFCSARYPIYAREIGDLLWHLDKNGLANDLHDIEPDLNRYIFHRASLLDDKLTQFTDELLPLLRRFFTERERHVAVVDFADGQKLERMTENICGDIGGDAELRALLAQGTSKYRKREGEALALVNGLGSISGASSARGGSVPPAVGASSSIDSDDSDGDLRTAVARWKRQRVNPPGRPNNKPNKNNIPDSTNRPRRPRPSLADFNYSHPSASTHRLKLTRPVAEGEYWSVSAERWTGMLKRHKQEYSHVAMICETELGTTRAAKPCVGCKKSGRTCDVYVDGEEVTAHVGRKCASCRIFKDRCSLVGV